MNQGKLIIGENPEDNNNNKTYDIVRCFMKTSRHYNSHRPDTTPKCQELCVTLDSSDVTDNYLYEWYINQFAYTVQMEITLDVLQPGGNSEVKKFKFTGARCFSLEEMYDIHLRQHQIIQLKIFVETMEPITNDN